MIEQRKEQRVSHPFLLGSLLVLVVLVVALARLPRLSGKAYLNLGLLTLSGAEKAGAPDKDALARYARAERLLQRAAGHAGSRQAAFQGLSQAYLSRHDLQVAAHSWTAGQLPFERLIQFGRHAESMQDGRAARAWYELAWAIDEARGAGTLATFLHGRGEHAAAVKVWRAALEQFANHPDRHTWWAGLCAALDAAQEWPQLAAASREALREFPESAPLLTFLGKGLYLQNQQMDEALLALQQAIAADDTYAPAYAAMALVMAGESRAAEAMAWYGEAIRRDPQTPWWYVARANEARKMGDEALAQELYQETTSLFPDYAPAQFELAGLYRALGETGKATAAIEQALALHAAPPARYYVRAGEIYESAAKPEMALTSYQAALELAPGDRRLADAIARLSGE